MNKKCTACKETKPIVDYNKNKSRSDGYQNICKTCSQSRSRQYYTDNRTKHIKIIGERKRRQNKINQSFIVEYLTNNPCVDCDETNLVVLQFDHQRDKKYNLSKIISAGYSLETIQEEIAKCQVRCANCHAKRTAKQFGWYRLSI